MKSKLLVMFLCGVFIAGGIFSLHTHDTSPAESATASIYSLKYKTSPIQECKDNNLGNKRPYVFLNVGNSMNPVFEKGDYVWSYKEEFKNLVVGDIITFDSGEEILTHRIIRNTTRNSLVTKGDNSPLEDNIFLTKNTPAYKVFMVTRGSEVVFCA